MPWPEVSRVMLRAELVRRWAVGERVSRLCGELGISRKTGYKWLRRWQGEGEAGLGDRSRRPRAHPWQVSAETEGRIVQLRQAHPAWGALKLKARLEADGHGMPSARTVGRVLQRQGLIQSPPAREPALGRFERGAPNELWQLDAKGWFILRGVGRIHPVAVLDDHSRYLLALWPCRRENHAELWQPLEQALGRYGCPQALLTDRHTVFHQRGGLTAWDCQLIALDIKLLHGRAHRPTTQGKVERLHLTLQQELLSRYRFADLQDCQRALQEWREMYNTYRPHQALQGAVPASRYRPSPRPRPLALPQPHYPPQAIVRQVTGAGLIKLNGHVRFVGRGLAGWPVGVIPTHRSRWPVLFFDRLVRKIAPP